MKSKKLLFIFVLMFFFFGNASAQVCYDPYYGYYDCDESYSNDPDAGQALVVGAMMGIILGGLLNSEEDHRGDYHRDHRHGGGDEHRGHRHF